MDNGIIEVIQLIGIPATCGGLIYIGIKLQVLDQLQTTTETIKFNLKAISDFLIQNFGFDPKELRDYSPLGLTEVGNQLIQKIGFDKVFQANKEFFFNAIQGESPKFKYDVGIAAIRSVYFLAQKPYMDFLKIYFCHCEPARQSHR